jgi:hypothetical protein
MIVLDRIAKATDNVRLKRVGGAANDRTCTHEF